MSGWGGENRGCLSDTPSALTAPPNRWANGYSEEKPLSVPRDAPFQLETCPLTAVDALGNSPAGSPTSQPQPAPWWDGRGGWPVLGCGLSRALPAVLRFFLEYQWFVDFAVYSGGVYVFTEAYYYVLGPAKETNIAVFWALLTVAFSVYPSSGCAGGQGGGRHVQAGLQLPPPQSWSISYQLLSPKNSPKLGGVKRSLCYSLSWAGLSPAGFSLL